jgi:lipoprotein-anchoring transpeptidase ErfK/SrfK
MQAAVFTDQYIFHHVVLAPGSNPLDEPVQSTSMQRHVISALLLSAMSAIAAQAEPLSLQPDRHSQFAAQPRVPAYLASQPAASHEIPMQDTGGRPAPVRYAAANSDFNLGGGFIEFLFSGGRVAAPRPPSNVHASNGGYEAQPATREPVRAAMDPKFLKQTVAYSGPERPGTIVIDTPRRFLYLVQSDGTAMRYGIGVGRPGFTWAGEKKVSAKKEWPDWTPPPEMLQRRPDLPHFMAGGPENPLGARALYLGSSLYRIHGSNEPWTIGQAVSSGCIRMRNEDVIDLYERVKLGTKVVVI